MPMSVRYTTVNGRVLCENRGGVETFFMPDTLGNVIETRDMATGAKTSETTYWPYGEIRTQTGTNPSPWGFCGIWGYLQDAAARLYVRARYLRTDLGRWMTVDPLWPGEPAYGYARSSPSYDVDPSGLLPLKMIVALVLAGLLSCAALGYLLFDYYAHNAFPHPISHFGHCMAACIIVSLLPYCAVLTPWASECIGEVDPLDFWGNTIGTACGLVAPTIVKVFPPVLESYCYECCSRTMRMRPPRR